MMAVHVTNIFLVIVCCVMSTCLGEKQMISKADDISVKLVGCFDETYEYQDFPYNVTDSIQPLTSDACVQLCLRKYFRYAILKDSHSCYCNSSYGIYSSTECAEQCRNSSDINLCIGNLTNAIFNTGQKASGPPSSLKLYNATETSIQIAWTPPLAPNDEILGYTVQANSIYTYSTTIPLTLREWKVPNSTLKTELLNLHPGTQYNISVAAQSKSELGVDISDVIWTEIGEPELPEVPKVLSRNKGQITIQLRPATNNNGPITAYQVVVMYEDCGYPFTADMMMSFQEAEQEGLHCYITAELNPKDLKEEFVVGDGRMYGKYYNPPLPPDHVVRITLGIVSTLNNVTKVKYADVNREEDGVLVLNVGDNMQDLEEGSSGMVIGLSVAICICGLLLLLSVIAYCMLRRHLGGRRRSSDHQEFSLQGPMVEVEPNGYIHNGYVPEEQEERVNHYENLKRQVWNIPRNFLDVRSDVLGCGQYGNVMRGTVQQRGFPIPVAIYTVADGKLPPDEKRSMLKDLGTLIRLGMHANIASLVGTCESPDTLYVAIEHHPATLKDVLLESRCLEHVVAPFSVNTSMSDTGRTRQKLCSLAEVQALETAIGIARGMDYLTSKKIVHTQLAARNVLMADGIIPKITGCGISRYNRHGENPDYTRWTAQEIFRGRSHVSKSDVWSFGCVLWEITAIGGTPYGDVPTAEVKGKVIRGHRLPQLQYVDDDVYQLMLECWQLNLDERPTFQEITHVLENMLEDSTIHLNFDMFAGFRYEPYLPEYEQCQ